MKSNARRSSIAPSQAIHRGFILAIALVVIGGISESAAQPTPTGDRIQAHLDSGEFPAAIELAKSLPTDQADDFHQRIAESQFRSGAKTAAFDSAGTISNDLQRSQVLTVFANHNPPYGDSPTGSPSSGFNRPATGVGLNRGGVTQADFFNLIELIRSTVDPDGWDDTNGDGTIQAYPSGVYVDSSGLLKKLRVDSSKLSRIRSEAMGDSGNRSSNFPSKLRKISLTRLERAAQLAASQGKRLDEDMLNLAGMYSIENVMVFPETGDVVIAGPAGPWTEDLEGRRVNTKTGKPVLSLDDLVVCLRNAYDNNGKFGCAITPREKNLAETKRVLATSTKRGKAWRDELQKTLGRQDVEVFGIDPQTHAGRILVEADYRMKLIGMGLEPTIPEIPSYLSRVEIQPDGSVPPMDVVRWWFTLNYDDVLSDRNRETFAFTGTGVKVLSENEMIDDLGQRIHTGQSKGPTREFARDFTRHFEKIADEYPVYNQLKNLFDLALVSSLIRHQGLADRVDWRLTFFGNDASQLTYRPALESTPREVDSVINHRLITRRKKSSTLKTTIVGISGGIRFDAHEAISADLIKLDQDGVLSGNAENSRPGDDARWWWD